MNAAQGCTGAKRQGFGQPRLTPETMCLNLLGFKFLFPLILDSPRSRPWSDSFWSFSVEHCPPMFARCLAFRRLHALSRWNESCLSLAVQALESQAELC